MFQTLAEKNMCLGEINTGVGRVTTILVSLCHIPDRHGSFIFCYPIKLPQTVPSCLVSSTLSDERRAGIVNDSCIGWFLEYSAIRTNDRLFY